MGSLYKSKQITRDTLYHEAKPLKQAVGETLEKGRYTAPELRMARFCNNLLEHFYALWTFLEVEGVERPRIIMQSVVYGPGLFGVRNILGPARSMALNLWHGQRL